MGSTTQFLRDKGLRGTVQYASGAHNGGQVDRLEIFKSSYH
jgi:hypothetical protein